jgi:hypothetical protein
MPVKFYRLPAFSLLLFIVGRTSAQSYQFPETFPEYYNCHAEEAFNKLNAKPLKGLSESQSTNFRMNTIYGIQEHIDRNEIYLDWPLLEIYVRKVLDTIIPKEYRQKYPLMPFVARNTMVNAWSNDNGFLFVNIGLLASLRNEAAFAATLAHESGHSIFDHEYNRYVDYVTYRNNHPQTQEKGNVQNFYSRNYEIIADTFSYINMAKCGYNLKAVTGKFDIYEREQERAIHRSLPYYSTSIAKRAKDYLRSNSTHPVNELRVKMALHYASKVNKQGLNYIIDSAAFNKIRKIAQEECKRLLFEKGDYKNCARRAFVDYLYNNKDLKNLYFLVESIRRILYVEPDLAKKGFLTDEYSDPEFIEYNQSVLKQPKLLFLDSLQEAELGKHILFTDPVKPFNNYEEALLYFCDKAKAMNLNEANFTLALYYYAKKDEVLFKSYLNTYIAADAGMYMDFAKVLAEKEQPAAPGKKLLILYDNSGMYAEDNFWYGADYYQLKEKSKLNAEIAPLLKPKHDSLTTKLLFINELPGKKPRELYEYQKLEQTLISLFNDKDKQNFRKKRVAGKEGVEDWGLTNKYTKNLFVYAPEYYKWSKDRDCGALCFANISYDFEEPLATSETRNDYTLYYFNFNVLRPYFKTGIRGVSNKKQSDTDIARDLADFLYGKDN